MWRRVGMVVLVSCSLVAGPVQGDELGAADLFPESTVGYVEVLQPKQLLELVLDHPIRHKLESLDQVKAAKEKKEYLDFKAGVAVIESQLGLPWRKILSQAAGGSVSFGFDARTQGVALLVEAEDETTTPKLVETIVNLVRLDATNKGAPDPVKTVEYRGVQVYGFDKTKIAVAGKWLVATNKDDLGKQLIDTYFDQSQNSLAKNAQFTAARSAIAADATAWAYVNISVLREADAAKKFYAGPVDNPVAELLIGGIFSTLKQTPYATLALHVDANRLALTAAAPHDRTWAGDTREYYFGPEGQGTAPALVAVNDALLALRTYRDVAGMWLRAGDLFNEKINDDLAKADSNLSTFFGGKDFGEDILGALKPELQVFVTRQSFAEAKLKPAIKLPAFGIVADLKDAATMQPELRRTFQSLIGFLNIVGAMNGQPQLELDMEKTDTTQLVTSSYLPDAKQSDPANLRIHHNFSPSIGFAGDRFVVASTKELARELVTAQIAEGQPASGNAATTNTKATLDFDIGRELLVDNRGQLVAQNMLQEGHTKEEAEAAIDVVLELVGWFQSASLQLDTTDKELKLALELTADASAQ